MPERFALAWARLPTYLGQHVILSATALTIGLALALPLGVAAARSPALRWPLMLGAALVQTIPSLALLALFYPMLLVLSEISLAILGRGFHALGFLPSVLALSLYAMPPILRNTVAGLQSVPEDARQAAAGVGMTPRQSLIMVELPIAAQVIMAGIRMSAVWVIGAATLATPVGQASLGNYIFSGLQTGDWISVLFGCTASAALAVAADQVLGLAESALAHRNRRLSAPLLPGSGQ